MKGTDRGILLSEEALVTGNSLYEGSSFQYIENPRGQTTFKKGNLICVERNPWEGQNMRKSVP